LIQGAVKLFKEVDINNDGTMEWEEFVQYIMDQVSSESIKPTVDRILGLKLSIAEIVSQRSDGEYRRFKKSTDHSYTDQGKHVKRIINTVACLGSSTNVIIHTEENQPILQFYTTEMQVLHRFSLPVEKKNVSVLCIAFQEFKLKKDVVGYSGSTALFVATCSDGCIYLYLKCMGEFRYWRCFSTGDVQNKIWFLPVQKVWLTTTRDFKLQQWTMKLTLRPKINEPMLLHKSDITDCAEVISPLCICTASLDKTIVMYDLVTRHKIRVLDGHRNGVKILISVQNYGGYLISCAFDVMPLVWQPGNIHGNCLLGKLKGHTAPVVSMINLPELPFIVTLDDHMIVNIWDVRNLFKVQTLSANNGVIDTWSVGLVAVNKSMFWTYRNSFESFDSQKIIKNQE
jgi:WD40 repeat protein